MRILVMESGSIPERIRVRSPVSRFILKVDASRGIAGALGGAAQASYQLYDYFSKKRGNVVDFFADFSAFTKESAVDASTLMGTDYDVILMNSMRDVMVVDEYMKKHKSTTTVYTDRANALLNYKDLTKLHPRTPAVFYLLQKMRRWLSCYVAITAEQELVGKRFFKNAKVAYIPIAPSVIFSPGKRKPDAPGSALYVGRLDERQKKLEFMIRSLKLLTDDRPLLRNWRLLTIVGDGPDRRRYERLVRELGLSKAIRFAGSLNDDKLVGEYRKAAFFVSTSEWESPGRTFLEAMACGIPLLVNTSNNAVVHLRPEKRMVEDGKNGMVYDYRDAGDFAEKFYLMYINRTLRKRLSGGALVASKGFSLGSSMLRYNRLMLSLLK